MHVETIAVESWRPISAEDLRRNLRRTSSIEDTLLAEMIESSTRYVERLTGTSVLGRTLRVTLDAWPADALELPAPPLRYAENAAPDAAVTLSYRDVNGAWQPAPDGAMWVVRDAQTWRLGRALYTLPGLYAGAGGLRVDVQVGYRDAAHFKRDAPDLRDAIMLHASHRDANREATIIDLRLSGVSRSVQHGFEALIAPYKVMTRYTDAWV